MYVCLCKCIYYPPKHVEPLALLFVLVVRRSQLCVLFCRKIVDPHIAYLLKES